MSRDETARVVCSAAEVIELKAAASGVGMSLSAWMRQVCLDAARTQSVTTQSQPVVIQGTTATAQDDQQLSQLQLQVSQLNQTVTYVQQKLSKLEGKVSQVQTSHVVRVATDAHQASSEESADHPVGTVLSCDDWLTFMGWKKTTISGKTKPQIKSITTKTGWKPQTGDIYGYWIKVKDGQESVKLPESIAIAPKQLMHLDKGFSYENQHLADSLVASMTRQGKRYYRDSSSRFWLLAEVDCMPMFQTTNIDHSLLKAIGRHYKVLEATEDTARSTPIDPTAIWDNTQDNSEGTQESQSLPIGTEVTTEELASLLSRTVGDLK